MDNNRMIKDLHLEKTNLKNASDPENYDLRTKGHELLWDLEKELQK